MAKNTTGTPANSAQAAAPADPPQSTLTKVASNVALIAPEVLSQYPILSNGKEAAMVMADNLAGESIGLFDMIIVKVPSGGMTQWEIPSVGGAIYTPNIDGIVLGVTQRRSFWHEQNPSGKPPDCESLDMEHGNGDPGGLCGVCPFAQFKSAKKQDGTPGLGQACKHYKFILMLVPNQIMPIVLKVPPASLKDMKKFQFNLPVRFAGGSVCRFSLNKTKNADGTDYAEVVPSLLGALPPESYEQIDEFAKKLKGGFGQVATRAAAEPDPVGE